MLQKCSVIKKREKEKIFLYKLHSFTNLQFLVSFWIWKYIFTYEKHAFFLGIKPLTSVWVQAPKNKFFCLILPNFLNFFLLGTPNAGRNIQQTNCHDCHWYGMAFFNSAPVILKRANFEKVFSGLTSTTRKTFYFTCWRMLGSLLLAAYWIK